MNPWRHEVRITVVIDPIGKYPHNRYDMLDNGTKAAQKLAWPQGWKHIGNVICTGGGGLSGYSFELDHVPSEQEIEEVKDIMRKHERKFTGRTS